MWVMLYGTIEKGLVIDHLDGNPLNNTVDNLHLKTRRANSQNQKLKSSNTSGVTGVYKSIGGWMCSWYDIDKKEQTKYFSIKKYGNDSAFQLAVDYRLNELQKLNAQGMDYTDRHMRN
jgi:TnpA family transposase